MARKPAHHRVRRRRRRRIAVGSVILLVSGGFLLRSPLFEEYAAASLAQYLEATTGESFVIGTMNIEPFRGRVSLDGIVISHPGAPPGEGTIAAIERVELQLELEGGLPRLGQVTIDRPSIRLHLDEDGLREFRAVSSQESSRAPSESFLWSRLHLNGATLTLDAPNDTSVRISNITLREHGGLATLSVGGGALQTPKLSQDVDPVVLSGVRLSPRRMLIPDLQIRTTSAEISGAILLQQDGPLRGLISLMIDLPSISPLLEGEQSLDGTMLLETDLSGTLSSPQIEGSALIRDAALIRPDRVIDFGDEVMAGWRIDGRQLLLEPLFAHWASGLVEINGSIDLRSSGFYIAASAEDLSLQETLRLAGVVSEPWVDMRADAELQLAGVFQPLHAAGSLTITGQDLEVAGGPISGPSPERLLHLPRVWLDGELSLTETGSHLIAHSAQLGRSRGRIDADIHYANARQNDRGDVDLSVNFSTLDLQDLRPLAELGLTGQGPASLLLTGPPDALSASATMDLAGFGFAGLMLADRFQGELRSPDLRSLLLPGFQATLGDSDYAGQLEIQLDTPSPEIDLQVLLRQGRIPDLAGVVVDLAGVDGWVDGVMSLQGAADALDGEIRLGIRDVDLYGEPFERGELVAWMSEGRFTLEQLALRRDRGGQTESLFARGSVGAGYATNLEVLSSGIRLETLSSMQGAETLRGDVVLDAYLGGTLQALEPSGRVALRQTRIQGRAVPPSTVQFNTTDGNLRFNGIVVEDTETGTGMEVAGELDLWTDQQYHVTAVMNDFPVSVFYPQAPDGSLIQALATGAVLLDGQLSVPESRVLQAAVSDLSIDWEGHRLRAAQPWAYELVGDRFALKGLALTDEHGNTQVRLDGGGVAGGTLALAGGGALDLDLLRMVVPGLQRTEGLALLDVAVNRTSRGGRAKTVVDVSTEGALVQGSWFPHPIEDLSMSLTATPDGFQIANAQGRIGGGPLSVSGRIDAQAWSPTHYDVRAQLLDARVRYLDFLPAMTGDAEISVNGPADDLLLSGLINVDEMLFSERIDWESWILEVSGERLRDAVAEETADLFSMDLRITADNTIRMRNNVAGLTAGGDLHLKGTTARPGMTGIIRAQPGGFVYLKERNFELQRAELTFLDPYSFDPEVDIAMSTGVSTREQEVEIEYLVRGLYSNWYAETRSDPPMSPADINALLLFGLTLDELERYGGLSSALVVEGGDLLASKLGIVEQVGEGIFQYELFQLDRVDLVSGVSERSYRAVTSELRLLAEKDLDWGATLRLEQNLNRVSDTYISLEQKLARRLYLRGFYATEQQERYLPVGGAYGLDVNVRWELD